MKKYNVILLTFFFSFLSLSVFSQNEKVFLVKKYVEFFNSGNTAAYDTLLAENCKSFSKKIISNKQKLIKTVKNLSKNESIEIVEVKEENKIVKTKEIFTDDIINYLSLKPIVRKREYHFNKKNKIKSIYNVDVKFPDDFKEKQERFLLWAKQNYPDLYQDMTVKFNSGKNISEERRYLLTLLKEEGLENLDKIKTDEKPDNKKYPYDVIFFDEFRMKVLLKTKNDIQKLFGSACEESRISGSDYWYYGSLKCKENYKGPKIIYKHNEKEVIQVQIEFNNSNIAVSVNAL